MSGEDTSLSKLADTVKAKSDGHCLVWMAAAGAAGPTDRITLLEEAAEMACGILPRYECTPLADRVTDLASGRQMQGTCVKKSAIPKLLSALLFVKNKKVEVYRKAKGGGYQLTNSGTPADFDSLKELLDPEDAASFGEDDGVMDDFSRPVAALSAEKAADGFPRIALFVLDKGARAVNVCSFADNMQCDLLESVLENVSPLECRVAKNWDNDSGAGQVM